MSSINVKTDGVKGLSGSLTSCSSNLSTVRTGVASIRYSIDSRILSRRNIGARINSACNSISALETKIQNLNTFINSSMDRYSTAETNILSKALGVGLMGQQYTSSNWNAFTLGPGYPINNPGLDGTIITNAGDGEFRDINEIMAETQREQLIAYGIVGMTGAANFNSNNLLMTDNGLSFRMYEEDGTTYIKIANGEILNQSEFQEYRNLLSEDLGGTAKWDRKFVTSLVNEGVPLYDDSGAGHLFKSNANKLSNTDLEGLGKYIGELGESKLSLAGTSFVDTLKDNAKVWESFSGWKEAENITKFGKAAGAVGIIATAADDAFSDFHDKNGWHFSGDRLKDFALDTSVDVGMGAAAMATGAAIGSVFLPPLGTVVGAGIGAAINFGLNTKFGGPPAESLVDHTKDAVKDVANHAINAVGDCIGSAGKALSKIFW